MAKILDEKCPKCGEPLEGEIVTSSDEAFDDWHEWCSKRCGYSRWVDGCDA